MNMIDNAIGKIIGNSKKRGGRNDWDGDGVPNKKDCQPRNTMRQDSMSTASRNIMDRFRKPAKNNNYENILNRPLVQQGGSRTPAVPYRGQQLNFKPQRQYSSTAATNIMERFRRMNENKAASRTQAQQQVEGQSRMIQGQIDDMVNRGVSKEWIKSKMGADVVEKNGKLYYAGEQRAAKEGIDKWKKQNPRQNVRQVMTPYERNRYANQTQRTQPTTNVTHGGAASRGYKGKIRR